MGLFSFVYHLRDVERQRFVPAIDADFTVLLATTPTRHGASPRTSIGQRFLRYVTSGLVAACWYTGQMQKPRFFRGF